MKKEIRPNSYWHVRYKHKTRGYTGTVQVKAKSPRENLYSCLLAKGHSDKKWVNYLSGTAFSPMDFVRPSTKIAFLYEKYKWHYKQSQKYLRQWDKANT